MPWAYVFPRAGLLPNRQQSMKTRQAITLGGTVPVQYLGANTGCCCQNTLCQLPERRLDEQCCRGELLMQASFARCNCRLEGLERIEISLCGVRLGRRTGSGIYRGLTLCSFMIGRAVTCTISAWWAVAHAVAQQQTFVYYMCTLYCCTASERS